MTNNKQQTAVEWLEQQIKLRGITHYFSIRELIEQAKEMEKEQRAVEIQKFIDKVNQKIDRELGWCGGPRNKSFEMENWRKAYANVRKWMQNLNKEFQQTYGGGEQ
jgi:hypothetical protein